MEKPSSPAMTGQPADLQRQIADLGPWFHNIHLPDGTQTAPQHFLGDFPSYKWQQIAPHLPERLEGWRALDIGCNAGFYSLELARRGARVFAIDCDLRYLRQATWAAAQLHVQDKIEFCRMQVYELAHTQATFDLVVFMGVFYHLRYPLLGLDIVARKAKRLLLFQTLTLPGEEPYQEMYNCEIHQREFLVQPGWPKMAFVENRLSGDPTNWWVPNHAAVEAMLRTCGQRVIARPGHEIYLCQPDPALPSNALAWNEAELLAATGRTILRGDKRT